MDEELAEIVARLSRLHSTHNGLENAIYPIADDVGWLAQQYQALLTIMRECPNCSKHLKKEATDAPKSIG